MTGLGGDGAEATSTAWTRLGPATRDSYVAVLEDGTELPVSRRGCARLNDLL